MSWELHEPPDLRAKYGPGVVIPLAEKLKTLLEQNGLRLPRFPGMVWGLDHLPDGLAVAVGLAEGEDGLLAYLFPADRVQFDQTREIVVTERTADGAEGPATTLHWFTPRG